MTLRLRATQATVLALALFLPNASLLAQENTRLLRQPDISKTDIVFVYGGDLWLVSRSGGVARRLTANPSVKRVPKFSPDGKWIAFTGNYDGNADIYLVPAEGGEPKRLTYHPALDDLVGWTPDSQKVLFRSGRQSHTPRTRQLYTLSINGGAAEKLPLTEAGLASFSPDGNNIAYNRIERENATWKRYRGGLQSYISLYDLKNNQYSELPHTDTTDFYPMWRGDKIYFASDRTNNVNLFCYDTKNKKTKQLTQFKEYDVKWPSAGSDAIVFEQAGVLQVFDLATEKTTPISVQIKSDMVTTRPHLRRVENNIQSFALSPSGIRALFEARGDIFTVPAKKGETRNITNTPGIREINPAWSPDAKSVAYLSDKTGEYDLYLRAQDGTGEETQITKDGKIFRTGPVWSPDSKALLYGDVAMNLWMVTLADKTPVLVDSTQVAQMGLGKWSHDSKWITYSKPLPNLNRALFLYSVEQKKAFQITDGFYDDREPTFDLNGKYLYFVSDRTFNPSINAPEIGINFNNQTRIYALTLQADTPSPFLPESDEEKAKEESAKPPMPPTPAPMPPPKPAGLKIDLEDLSKRIIALPLPAANYVSLNAGTNKLLYQDSGSLHQFDMGTKSATPLMPGVQAYDVNATGTKIIYSSAGAYGIMDAAPGMPPGTGRLNVALEMNVDPRAEWAQMFNEAWRLERDFYYDVNMHGLDWKAVGERYRKLVPSVAHRSDLSYLLGELIGELNTSHAYVQEGELPQTPQVSVGLLGADYEADGKFYRFKKILEGENWTSDRFSPLRQPGVKVKEGEYLLAVNGVPVTTAKEPFAYFENTLGKAVVLKVNDKASMEGAREVTVRPIANDIPLRYSEWVETNRRKVSQATGGRVGYIHVPDTAIGGITEFGKAFYAQLDKDALIIDERFNSGGFIPDFFVEKLSRKLLSAAKPRYGQDFTNPGGAVYGPKVILANEWSGSGGDAFPYYFRKAGVGPIIGKRTWGGLVGISGGVSLLDGGAVTVPQFGIYSPQDNKWIAENRGVEPDMEVNNTPDKMLTGGDPQLERAIAYILDQLKKNPPKKVTPPPFPVEKLDK